MLPLLLAPLPFAFSASGLAERDAALLTLGDKEAFPLGIAQDPISGDPFPKSFEQALG